MRGARRGLGKAGAALAQLGGQPSVRQPRGPAGHRGPKAVRVVLAEHQRKALEEDVRRRGMAYGQVMRARIILELGKDSCVSEVARRLGTDRKTVRFWRDRYLRGGRDGLGTRHRRGRPVEISAVSRCQVIGMACGKPSDFGVAHRETWTVDSLLTTFLEKYPDLSPMSRTSLLRILNEAEIRPHRMKVWLHSPDPLFREKVTEICGLYLNPTPGSMVLCVDEKTGMQALGRKHPGRRPAPGRDGRADFEYIRHGTKSLIAAFNPHTGEVYGEVCDQRTADRLMQFMEALARKYPDRDIHIVWDNLNTHHEGPDLRWSAFNERHGNRFHFHYTPIHASWVNQVEVFFGIVSRRVLRHAVYDSKEALAKAVRDFVAYWNAHEKHPFRWTFAGYPPVMVQEQLAA